MMNRFYTEAKGVSMAMKKRGKTAVIKPHQIGEKHQIKSCSVLKK